MRKRVRTPGLSVPAAAAWLPLEQLVQVEVTSEDPAAPIEAALLPAVDGGWQAAQAGVQTIRLIFDQPHTLRRIWLRCVEREHERMQEVVLRWSPDQGHTFHELVRQQWNFSPAGAPEEVEDDHVTLVGVTVLELTLVPDTRGGPARAALAALRLALRSLETHDPPRVARPIVRRNKGWLPIPPPMFKQPCSSPIHARWNWPICKPTWPLARPLHCHNTVTFYVARVVIIDSLV